ncbi:MAG: hypothetical protein FJY77_00385 [Candidatus Altiarchaeales archaeon]|nr:hypothetical protein [Candidatus Altiarchaeales archaeon]
MKELIVYDGHFWVNLSEMLAPERKNALKQDVENTEGLILVEGELWARLETPHPTKKQKAFYKAPWRQEDIESAGSLKKMPEIRE